MPFDHADMSKRFKNLSKHAIETKNAGDALKVVATAYDGDMRALVTRANGQECEARSMALQLQTNADMVRFMHNATAQQILLNAKLEAHTRQLRRIVDRVRRLTTEARTALESDGDGKVPCVDLEAVLELPVEEPEIQPQVLAYQPEQQRSIVGQFKSDDGAVVVGYPLVGWSLVLRPHEHEPRKLEPTFLVDDRALPVSFLTDTYGLKLERIS